MLKARIGSWYEDLQTGAQFKVVAVDDDTQTIETQMLEGEICEYEFDNWMHMTLRAMDEPEDWRNSYELADEDARDPDTPIIPDDFSNPLDTIEPDIMQGTDDDFDSAI